MKETDEFPERSYPAARPAKRLRNQSTIIFVTACSKDRRKIFADRRVHDLLVRSWREADAWLVGRYVILPDHVHLFAAPNSFDPPAIKQWARYWKSLVTKGWPFERTEPIWQRGIWDRQLRSRDSYVSKWKYVRNNPIRHDLAEQADAWPYQGQLNALPWKE